MISDCIGSAAEILCHLKGWSLLLRKVGVLTGLLGLLLISSCTMGAGGGGSTQIAPDSVKAGEAVVIRLQLSVWGAGGPIKGRYTDIQLSYRLVGENGYTTVLPKPVSADQRHEIYEFMIPPYPQGTRGEIEFHFELKLDGQTSRIEGLKKIKCG